MANTRRIHLVRVTQGGGSGASGAPWADIVVCDSVAVRGENGQETLYDVTATKANPFIKDDTGDGNEAGDKTNCSRSSHMVRLTSVTDSTQMFDAEVLDAFSVRGPNGQETTFILPSAKKNDAVKDNTGLGLDVAASSSTTRANHIAKISEVTSGPGATGATGGSTNTDYPPVDPNTSDRYVAVTRMDAINFKGPNGEELTLVVPDPDDKTANDTTQYNSDGSPPNNTDPNHYLFWPQNSSGPWLGANPTASDGSSGGTVDQGPLWWIKRLGQATPQPGPTRPFNVHLHLDLGAPIVNCGSTITSSDGGPLPNGPAFRFQLVGYRQTGGATGGTGGSGASGPPVQIEKVVSNTFDYFEHLGIDSGFITVFDFFTGEATELPVSGFFPYWAAATADLTLSNVTDGVFLAITQLAGDSLPQGAFAGWELGIGATGAISLNINFHPGGTGAATGGIQSTILPFVGHANFTANELGATGGGTGGTGATAAPPRTITTRVSPNVGFQFFQNGDGDLSFGEICDSGGYPTNCCALAGN